MFKYIIVLILVGIVIQFLTSYIFFLRSYKKNKVNIFESGFNVLNNQNIVIDNNYLILGFLYLIFDIEVIYLIPWVLQGSKNVISLMLIIWFLVILIITLIFEILYDLANWYD